MINLLIDIQELTNKEDTDTTNNKHKNGNNSEHNNVDELNHPNELNELNELNNSQLKLPQKADDIILLVEKTTALFSNKKSSLKVLNFMVSFGIVNFLWFIYSIEVKMFAYSIDSLFYFMTISAFICSFFLSYIMNLEFLGRKKTKIGFLLIFILLIILKSRYDLGTEAKQAFIFYNINRMFLGWVSMVNHTHLNETFSQEIRLKVYALAYLFGKTVAATAPFIFEFLQDYYTWVLILCATTLVGLFSLQDETLNKELD